MKKRRETCLINRLANNTYHETALCCIKGVEEIPVNHAVISPVSLPPLSIVYA